MSRVENPSEAAMELLPCPFCGGEADLRTYQTESLWSHDIVTYTQVGCSECDYSFATELGYEMEAPERWNTRVDQHLPRWQDIATAPTDGTTIMVWADGFVHPEIVRWAAYDDETAAESGEPGYWTYAEELLADATDSCEPETWSHWMPLPASPLLTERARGAA